jgi:hypothetical protein
MLPRECKYAKRSDEVEETYSCTHERYDGMGCVACKYGEYRDGVYIKIVKDETYLPRRIKLRR